MSVLLVSPRFPCSSSAGGGFLLGTVFIYLNVNNRITKREKKVFPEGGE